MHSPYPSRLPLGFIAGQVTDSDSAEVLDYVRASVRAAGLPEFRPPPVTDASRRGAGPQPPHPEE